MEDPFEKIFDRFDRVTRKNLERWKSAADKVQSGVYKADDYVSDAVGAWFDSTIGWLSEEEPVVQMKLVKGIVTAQGTVSSFGAGSGGQSDYEPFPSPEGWTEPGSESHGSNSASMGVPRAQHRPEDPQLQDQQSGDLVSEVGAVDTCSVEIGTTVISRIRAVIKS